MLYVISCADKPLMLAIVSLIFRPPAFPVFIWEACGDDKNPLELVKKRRATFVACERSDDIRGWNSVDSPQVHRTEHPPAESAARSGQSVQLDEPIGMVTEIVHNQNHLNPG